MYLSIIYLNALIFGTTIYEAIASLAMIISFKFHVTPSPCVLPEPGKTFKSIVTYLHIGNKQNSQTLKNHKCRCVLSINSIHDESITKCAQNVHGALTQAERRRHHCQQQLNGPVFSVRSTNSLCFSSASFATAFTSSFVGGKLVNLTQQQ